MNENAIFIKYNVVKDRIVGEDAHAHVTKVNNVGVGKGYSNATCINVA